MKIPGKEIEMFLSQYDAEVYKNALVLREIIFANLPNIIEQIDAPANMIPYCYSQKYAGLICVIIPSKKGLKLGFNRGTSLPDPDNLLEGKGKISRYVQIKSSEQINSPALKQLLTNALDLYQGIIVANK